MQAVVPVVEYLPAGQTTQLPEDNIEPALHTTLLTVEGPGNKDEKMYNTSKTKNLT